MRYLDPMLLDLLAADYVLGTLHGGARRRFERLLEAESAARDAVEVCAERLHVLATVVPPVAPSAELWRRISRRTAGSRARAAQHLRARLSGLFGGLVVAGVLGTSVLALRPEWLLDTDRLAIAQQRLPHSYVGILSDAQGQPAMTVGALRHGTRMRLKALKKLRLAADDRFVLVAIDEAGHRIELGVVAPGDDVDLHLAAPAGRLLARAREMRLDRIELAADGSQRATTVLAGPCARFW